MDPDFAERGKHAAHEPSPLAGDLGGRFDLLDVNGICGGIQRSGYDNGLSVILLGRFLIIEGHWRFRSG